MKTKKPAPKTKSPRPSPGAGTQPASAPPRTAADTGKPEDIPFDALAPGYNARTFTADETTYIADLAESIAARGLLARLIVFPHPTKKGKFDIHGGECRYRALEQLIKAKRWTGPIPCSVQPAASAAQREVAGLMENLQRRDLNPMDKALGLQHAIQTGDFDAWNESAPARSLGHLLGFRSKSTIYGLLNLVSLCKLAQQAVRAGELSASVGEKLARIRDPKLQLEATRMAILHKWTDADAARYIEQDYQKQLNGAPFDRDDATLVPRKNGEGGACADCPWRSGNQAEMFGEFASPGRGDMCLKTSCFALKVEATWKRRAAAHAKAGGKVLTAKEAEAAGLRRYYSSIGGGYVDADAISSEVPGRKTFGELCKDAIAAGRLSPELARGNDSAGRIYTLLPAKKVEALLGQIPEVKKARAKQEAARKPAISTLRATDYAVTSARGKRMAAALNEALAQARQVDLLAAFRALVLATVADYGDWSGAALVLGVPDEGKDRMSAVTAAIAAASPVVLLQLAVNLINEDECKPLLFAAAGLDYAAMRAVVERDTISAEDLAKDMNAARKAGKGAAK